MLDNSLTLLEVHLVLDKLFQQTLHVSYFNEIILGSFGHGLVNKSIHYVLAILPSLFRDNSVQNQ